MFEQSTSFTVRPKPQSLLAIAGVAAIWSAVIAIVFLQTSAPWVATVNGALMVAFVLAAWRFQSVGRIYEQGGSIYYHDGILRPREIANGREPGWKVLRIDYTGQSEEFVDYWIGPDGLAHFKSHERQWAFGSMLKLWNRAGVAVETEPVVIDVAQADRRYPEAKLPFIVRLGFVRPLREDPELRVVRPAPDPSSVSARRIAMVIALPLIVLSQTTLGLIPTVVFAFCVAGLLLGVQELRIAQHAIYDDGVVISHRRPLERTRTVAKRGEPGRVVRVRMGLLGRSAVQLLWVDAHGRCRMQLHEKQWNTDSLTTLRERLGWPLEQLEGSLSPAELKRRYPRAK